MTDTVTTLATGNISEEVIAEYLQGLGIDPMEPMWKELDSTIRPLIPQFLAAGGSYTRKVQVDGYQPSDHTCVPHPRHLAMVASYGDKSVELRLHKYNAYTSIHLIHPYGASYFHDHPDWCGVEVHPKYLDIVLCSMFGVEYKSIEAHSPLSIDDVLPLIPRFIEAGGTYQEVVDARGVFPIKGVRVSYAGKSVLLANSSLGSSGISLLIPNNLETGFVWEELKVGRDRLDAVVCDWLRVVGRVKA